MVESKIEKIRYEKGFYSKVNKKVRSLLIIGVREEDEDEKQRKRKEKGSERRKTPNWRRDRGEDPKPTSRRKCVSGINRMKCPYTKERESEEKAKGDGKQVRGGSYGKK